MKIVVSLVIISLSFLFLQSCDKNKELVQYSEHYHIDGNDTVSAIFIPNSFTPDGDGINDVFKVYTDGNILDSISFLIYNNQGENVFSTVNIDNNWDGTYKPSQTENGQYHYKLIAIDYTNYEFIIEGKVNLVR